MSANLAGIVGGQLFRSDDLPFYHRGWTIAVAFMAFAVVCVIVLVSLYAWLNQKLQRNSSHSTARVGTEKKTSDASEEGAVKLYNY